MGQLHIRLPFERALFLAVIAFDKQLPGAAVVFGGQLLVNPREADLAFALDLVVGIAQAAVQTESVPGVAQIQAGLVGVDAGFAAAPRFYVAAAAAQQHPGLRALFEDVVDAYQQAGAAVADV